MEVRVLSWALCSPESVLPAAPGEFQPLAIGPLRVDPPVVLAPMAGVTNAPFRRLCREFSGGGGLFVSEMIVARALASGHAKTERLAAFGAEETVRSAQLAGTEPDSLAAATRLLIDEWGVDHIDLNFGCPVRKITANGGGAAIPARPRLMARMVRAVVAVAGEVPVTVKFRIGIDATLTTFRDAGHVAEQEGCAAVALHGRTAAQLYQGAADWTAIAELKQLLTSIPVLGNGDIFAATDALRMMRQTQCDGVVIGRGCLGRPWLFRELGELFAGRPPTPAPTLGLVVETALRHADLLIDFFGADIAARHMRKFAGWYLRCFPGIKAKMPALHRIESRAELEDLLRALPPQQPYPVEAIRARRCKSGRTQRVVLPPGFLTDSG